MSSVKCTRCGMVCWASAGACNGCGNPLAAPAQQNYHYANAAGAATYAPGSNGMKKRAGLAIASLVIGIISMPTLGLLGIGAFVGIALGIAALMKAKQQPSEYGGQGLAIGGIVTSVLSLMLAVPIGIVAAIAVPNLLAARRSANEASAIRTVRLLAEAENVFHSSAGKFGELSELQAANLVDAKLGQGFLNGYYFKVTLIGETYEVSASPVKYPSDGTRSFYLSSEDAVVHAADRRGLPADAYDPPLRDYRTQQSIPQPGSPPLDEDALLPPRPAPTPDNWRHEHSR